MKSILEGNEKVLMRSLRGWGMKGLQYILQLGINTNEEVTTYEQSRCIHESDPRRGHAGAGTAGRGPPRRLRARRLGDALRHDGSGRGKYGLFRCPAAGPTDLRGLLYRLAQPNRQPLHGGAKQHPEVCCVNDALRAAPVEQLHAS